MLRMLCALQAVSYGLSMLRRSGGAIKQGVRASNSYEKKLLAEVRLTATVVDLLQNVTIKHGARASNSHEKKLVAWRQYEAACNTLGIQHTHICRACLSYFPPFPSHSASAPTFRPPHAQVLSPEDCGGGFAEVGALEVAAPGGLGWGGAV